MIKENLLTNYLNEVIDKQEKLSDKNWQIKRLNWNRFTIEELAESFHRYRFLTELAERSKRSFFED